MMNDKNEIDAARYRNRLAKNKECEERTGRQRVTINMDRETAALWNAELARHSGPLDTLRALLAKARLDPKILDARHEGGRLWFLIDNDG